MSDANQKNQSKWPLIISFILLASLVGAYFAIPEFKSSIDQAYQLLTSGNREKISGWVRRIGVWGPVFIALAMVIQMFLFVIPSPLLMVVAVIAYGPVWGAALSTFSVALASTVGYFIGRYLGESTVDKLIGHKKEEKIRFYIERYSFWAVCVVRLTPLLSNDAISFVGGLIRMGYWKFMGATLAGIIPLTALIGYFGESNQRLRNGLLWISVISFVILVVYIIYDKKKNPSEKEGLPS